MKLEKYYHSEDEKKKGKEKKKNIETKLKKIRKKMVR